MNALYDGRGQHGGARDGAGRKPSQPEVPHDPETGEFKTDIIRLEYSEPKKRSSDYGTASQTGLRRLEKAAEATQ